ncbi:MAG: hypothetical protein ACRD3W_18110 [Terriglobales bacterium]
MKRFTTLCIVLAVAGAGVVPSWAMDAVAIKQNSEEWGPIEATLCAKGMRMETSEFTILMKPPDWSATVMNLEAKRYVEIATDDFKPLMSVEELKHRKSNPIKVMKVKPEQIAGIPCDHYVCKPIDPKNTLMYELWTTTNLQTDTKLNNACLRFMAVTEVPRDLGLLLKFIRRNGKKEFVYLSTSEVKRIKIDDLNLKRPRYLSKADSLIDILGDSSGHEELMHSSASSPGSLKNFPPKDR